jgi:hypothetical protein
MEQSEAENYHSDKDISCVRPNLLSECSLLTSTELSRGTKTDTQHQALLDDNSTVEPPEPIPNSEVKRSRADGSVGFPHVRVGHRQALILKTLIGLPIRVFFRLEKS